MVTVVAVVAAAIVSALVVTPTLCVARTDFSTCFCPCLLLLPSVVGQGSLVSDGSFVRVLKCGHFTLEGVNGPHNLLVCFGLFCAEWLVLIAEEGVHDGTLPWLGHVWAAAQVTLIDVAKQFINAIRLIDEGDDDWTLPM